MEELIQILIKIASTAPSGANMQPWTYVLIRDESKYMIAVFKQNYGIKVCNHEVSKIKHYYVTESVSLSVGFLISALEYLGIKYDMLPLDEQITKELNRPVNESLIGLISISDLAYGSDLLMEKAVEYYQVAQKRRSVRHFLKQPFEKAMLIKAIDSTNKILKRLNKGTPYQFMIVDEEEVKRVIRENAEEVEKRLYQEIISEAWKTALSSLGTNWEKKHLTEAPYLIIVFMNQHTTVNTKYITGIATGILIQNLNRMGLSTLTYTPSPMKFLNEICKIEMEPFMVLPVGYRDVAYPLPDINKKKLDEIIVYY